MKGKCLWQKVLFKQFELPAAFRRKKQTQRQLPLALDLKLKFSFLCSSRPCDAQESASD